MGIETLIKRLNQYSQYLIAYKLGADFADTCMDAAAVLSTLQTENKKLRAELEKVKRERDAAVEDVAAIIGDVEEIRRGYGVDNADADGAFAELCETYCTNKGRFCYAECEKYHCKNFKWRGQKED